MTIPVSSSDTGEGTVNVSSLTFTSANWSVPQTVTITGVNDNIDDGNVAYSIVLGAATSTDPGYNGLDAGDVALSNQDDDTAGITRGTPSGTTTSENGASVTFTIRLNSEPTSSVTVAISSSDTTEGTVSSSALVFTAANWNLHQTVTVTGVDDLDSDGDVAYTVVVAAATSADPLYNGLNPADVALTNLDNDAPPPPPASKFYVLNDASQNRTYEYGADGSAIENYLLDSGNTAPRGAAMTAAGDKVWVVDANRNVYVYDNNGGLLGSWAAGTMSSRATVQGIATDGTNIWIVDSRADRVYYYANAASRLSGSQTASSFALGSGNTAPAGIVFGNDGANRYLWVVNNSSVDRVYRYSVATNGGISLLNSWTLNSANSRPTGITLDPSNASQDMWVVDSSTDRIYRYANARTLTAPTLTESFALAAGNTNPTGIADPPPPAARNAEIRAELPGARANRSLAAALTWQDSFVGPMPQGMAEIVPAPAAVTPAVSQLPLTASPVNVTPASSQAVNGNDGASEWAAFGLVEDGEPGLTEAFVGPLAQLDNAFAQWN